MLRTLKALTVRDVFDIICALTLMAVSSKALLRENAPYALLIPLSVIIFPASVYLIWAKLKDAARRTAN